MAESVKRQVRRFTGQVSMAAAEGAAEPLMLEHFKRIQTTLSDLVERHRAAGTSDAAEFMRIVLDFEQVHIVTRSENYAAMRAKGDYKAAKIELRSWSSLPEERRSQLWRTMLRGKVANALEFAPQADA